ncbi:MAG: hypothetical protein NC191_03450 [Muribaculaceae bacterium]|nr:hypothetical protein [Muribaculaceae bacterium]
MDNDIRLETENLASQLKYFAALEGLTMISVKQKINQKYNKNDSNRNLSNKLRTKTFRVSELVELVDVLGYDVFLHKRK